MCIARILKRAPRSADPMLGEAPSEALSAPEKLKKPDPPPRLFKVVLGSWNRSQEKALGGWKQALAKDLRSGRFSEGLGSAWGQLGGWGLGRLRAFWEVL